MDDKQLRIYVLAGIIVVAAFLTERRIHFRPWLFGGYIGIPYPVNFLENRSARLFLVLAYACYGTIVYQGVLQGGQCTSQEGEHGGTRAWSAGPVRARCHDTSPFFLTPQRPAMRGIACSIRLAMQ